MYCPITQERSLKAVPHSEETPLDRELQSKAVAKIMADTYPEPFIFLGYVVTDPHAPSRTFSSPFLYSS